MTNSALAKTLPKDLIASVVVFLVALPLCLGIAHASGAPLMSGIVAGVVGGILVGWLSGSHTSVSGPAAGLTAIVLSQIGQVGFQSFLVAVMIAGAIQILLGVFKAGIIGAYFPSNVIKGLLAAIGIILILKQFPHMLGHDADPEGDFSFKQPDGETTFSSLIRTFTSLHWGATLIGVSGFALITLWDKTRLKSSIIPSALIVVILGVLMNYLFGLSSASLVVGTSHLVQVPEIKGVAGFKEAIVLPDFSSITNPKILIFGFTIAIVASLETLLNLEAVDKLDPKKRVTPSNRELFAQGVGNLTSGLFGGLPMTSVVVRGSVNVLAGSQTKVSAIVHGFLLFLSVLLLPHILNLIPLASLAAILVATGLKLAKPALFTQMWKDGWTQFVPFIITVVAIVFTDLLVGILIGLGVSIFFILRSNLRRPFRLIEERHISGGVTRIELSNQVSFLNKAALSNTFSNIPAGSNVVIDARNTDYIDPDIQALLRDLEQKVGPARNFSVNLVGFKNRYTMEDKIQFVDISTRDVQAHLDHKAVLQILKEGNDRFVRGESLQRDLVRQIDATALNQFPMAIVLGCMDSRIPTEMVFDVGLGDIFSTRIAGNVLTNKVLASMEYACHVAGAKLVVVLGHTRCQAIRISCDMVARSSTDLASTGCDHLPALIEAIRPAIEGEKETHVDRTGSNEAFVSRVSRVNVQNTIAAIYQRSGTLRKLVDSGKIAVVGAIYDVATGRVEFLTGTGGSKPEIATKTPASTS
jgi:carbonic anhydrase